MKYTFIYCLSRMTLYVKKTHRSSWSHIYFKEILHVANFQRGDEHRKWQQKCPRPAGTSPHLVQEITNWSTMIRGRDQYGQRNLCDTFQSKGLITTRSLWNFSIIWEYIYIYFIRISDIKTCNLHLSDIWLPIVNFNSTCIGLTWYPISLSL